MARWPVHPLTLRIGKLPPKLAVETWASHPPRRNHPQIACFAGRRRERGIEMGRISTLLRTAISQNGRFGRRFRFPGGWRWAHQAIQPPALPMGPNPTPEGVRTGRKRQHTQGGRKRVGFPPCWGLPSVKTGGTGPDFDSLGGGVGTYSDSDRFSPLSPEHALPPPTNRPLLGRIFTSHWRQNLC